MTFACAQDVEQPQDPETKTMDPEMTSVCTWEGDETGETGKCAGEEICQGLEFQECKDKGGPKPEIEETEQTVGIQACQCMFVEEKCTSEGIPEC